MGWVYIVETRLRRACSREVRYRNRWERRKEAMPKIFPFRRSAAAIDFGSKKPRVSVEQYRVGPEDVHDGEDRTG